MLQCPICNKHFKLSKNQNCNLRRHLMVIHNMPAITHPRLCKWDSLPNGRIKNDTDRKERARTSKRLWARRFRQRQKAEEVARILIMLSQT